MAKVWTDDDVARAAAMYEGGQSLTAVAEVIGSSPDTVASHLRKAGVTIRPQSLCKLDDDQLREIERLFRQGDSQASIAQRYGVSRAAISNLLRRAMPDEYAEHQASAKQLSVDARAQRQAGVLAVIRQQGRASRLEISQATGINYSTVKMDVDRLVGDGLIHRVGSGRTTGYAAL
ncbi:MAG: helix-turn-helix domain-containing protein [Bifidobacteriaceae bacterium]|nr:helix-turn-helix domain-containing protein [Bifidobacteriaceae bacterium]